MKHWWLVLMSRSRSDSATTGLGNSGYQSVGARLLVKMSDRPPLGDQLVEVVGLGCGELAHGEVVEDQDGGAGELASRLSQVRSARPPARSARTRLVLVNRASAPAGGEVAQGLGDVVLPTPTGP